MGGRGLSWMFLQSELCFSPCFQAQLQAHKPEKSNAEVFLEARVGFFFPSSQTKESLRKGNMNICIQ